MFLIVSEQEKLINLVAVLGAQKNQGYSRAGRMITIMPCLLVTDPQ